MGKYALVFIALIAVGFVAYSVAGKTELKPQTVVETPEEVNFTARFEIYTLGTKRIFTADMYHNQSADVFIQNPDPSIVNVRKAGITWADFFATLPFELKSDCLLTGTGQTFCNNETQRLHFTLNDVEVPSALDLEIKPEDNLVVEYY